MHREMPLIYIQTECQNRMVLSRTDKMEEWISGCEKEIEHAPRLGSPSHWIPRMR
jgi:hypothetical protein